MKMMNRNFKLSMINSTLNYNKNLFDTNRFFKSTRSNLISIQTAIEGFKNYMSV